MSTQAMKLGITKRPIPDLKLSPLLRFALATARPDPEGKPALLPMKIPKRCCGKNFRCTNFVRWQIRDRSNVAYICAPCAEDLWEMYDALDFTIHRI